MRSQQKLEIKQARAEITHVTQMVSRRNTHQTREKRHNKVLQRVLDSSSTSAEKERNEKESY